MRQSCMLVCPPAGVGRIEIPSCDFEAWKCDLRAAAQVPKHAAIAGWFGYGGQCRRGETTLASCKV